jgi:hypothetical protein
MRVEAAPLKNDEKISKRNQSYAPAAQDEESDENCSFKTQRQLKRWGMLHTLHGAQARPSLEAEVTPPSAGPFCL